MQRALVLQHVPHEGPGRIRPALEAAGVNVEVARLDRGHAVPEDCAFFDVLVVMGGPMGVGDLDDPRYPFLRPELRLIEQALSKQVPVLGICLGAQLLAHALGASVHPNLVGEPPVAVREVGWGALIFDRASDRRGLLSGLSDAEIMFHWHGDTFDLPPGAELLASTLHCPNQLFGHGRNIGVQFHPELDEGDIHALLEADAAYARSVTGTRGAARILSETVRWFPRYREVGDVLLKNLVRALLSG